MKIKYLTILLLAIIVIKAKSQSDSVYIMHSGKVVFRELLSEIDSVTFYNSATRPIGEVLSFNSKFSIFNEALSLTGISRKINQTEFNDLSFDPSIKKWVTSGGVTVTEEYPKEKRLGFTILALSDSVLANFKDCPVCPNGVRSVKELEYVAKYYYSGNSHEESGVSDYKDSCNYLNRFISYHCLNKALSITRFIKDFDTPHMIKTYDMFEYLETMLDNSLIEVLLDRDYKNTNSEFGLINCMGQPSQAITFVRNYNTGVAINGYYHEISKPLIFSEKLISDLSSKRLRMDISSFFKELASNNMRGNNPRAVADVENLTHEYILPTGYLDGFKVSEKSKSVYIGACEAVESYQGDLFFVNGNYDLTFETTPVPAGKYEIRISIMPLRSRDKILIYLDDSLMCDTVDLSILSTDPRIGWVLPGIDINDPLGIKNDKSLREKGYMKGPSSYYCSGHWFGYNAKSARLSNFSLRKILGIVEFKEFKKHKIRVVCAKKNSPDAGIELDYIEFMPVNLIEYEDID